MLLWTKNVRTSYYAKGFPTWWVSITDIWKYYFWGQILWRQMLQSFRKLDEIFHTEHGFSLIRKECVFTSRYCQCCARTSRSMVVNFFFNLFFRKTPPFYVSDGLDTFHVFLKGSAHQFGSVRRGQEIKPVSSY